MNIQLEKAFLIEQIQHIDDADLIHALKSLLKIWLQERVDERFYDPGMAKANGS